MFVSVHKLGDLFRFQYLDKIPLLRSTKTLPSTPRLLGILLLIFFTAYGTWWGIKNWGYTHGTQGSKFLFQGGGNLAGIWLSENDGVLGYRQDRWKLTLFRWSSSKVPSAQSINLDEYMPENWQSPISSKAKSEHQAAVPNASVQPKNRTESMPSAAVSQNFSVIAWAWGDKLYVLNLSEIASSSRPKAVAGRSGAIQGRLISKPTPRARVLDLPSQSKPVALRFVGLSSLIIQDTNANILLYDIEHEKIVRGIGGSTPCPVVVSGLRALLACPASDLRVLDLSSSPASEVVFHLPQQNTERSTAFALSLAGNPAVATDSGSVFVWHSSDGPSTEHPGARFETLQSPGVAQALVYDGDFVLAGGGFRGLYLLQQGISPTQVVSDITGTMLLATGGLRRDSSGNCCEGTIAVATREDIWRVHLTNYDSLNARGYGLAAIWIAFWGSNLLVIPIGRFWLEEVRRRREVRLRGELERSLERVPTGGEPIPVLPVPEPPDELIRGCVEGNCVAFIGAGLGAQAGLPTWRPLIQSLLGEVSREGLLGTTESQSLQEAISEGQTDLVADGLVSTLRGKEQVLYDSLSRTLLRQDVRPTRAHDLLRYLNLSAVLTTSFDNLLESTFRDRVQAAYTHQDADKLLEAITKRQFFLLKAYGALDRPDSVVLASFQYYEAMARNLLFSRFMEQLFTSRTLLFVGAGLEGIESYLNGIKFPTSMPQRHFALVAAQSGGWRAKADLLNRRYGIQVLAFTPQPEYPEIEQFLDKLSAAVRAKGIRSVATSKREVSRLSSVTLENIGPFDHLELELDSNWNILLGDNGVGKSTILKAIAVGIAGADAADFAGRLVKSGKEKEGAKITLRTQEGKNYITVIKKGDRTIVDSSPSRPLEPERWLAFGFPPLRTFTLSPVGELPAKGLERLTSEDLMPLIRGELDPRLDKLKGWIIDLYLRDKERKASDRSLLSYFRQGEASTQFTRLLDQFFEIIRKLTPGLKIGDVVVDSDKKEVKIETDDGLLRIELVSQGTQSLLGWVGILLQRLNDFYGAGFEQQQSASTTFSLLDQYSLVLMDEIDAHMHPLWQKLLVQNLGGLFKNTQFIATTHSPLIVSSLGKENVKLFVRDFESRKVRVEIPSSDFMGLRADQILTSDLFGLQTTRSRDTVEKIRRFSKLLAAKNRTEEEERELALLRKNLDDKLWRGETQTEREIEKTIQTAFIARQQTRSPESYSALKEVPPDIALEIRRQIGELLGEPEGTKK